MLEDYYELELFLFHSALKLFTACSDTYSLT